MQKPLSSETKMLGVMYKELGIMYKEGKDVKKNIKLALDYLNKASEQGNYDATLLLATMYSLGEDVKTDYTKSNKYFKRLEEQQSKIEEATQKRIKKTKDKLRELGVY